MWHSSTTRRRKRGAPWCLSSAGKRRTSGKYAKQTVIYPEDNSALHIKVVVGYGKAATTETSNTNTSLQRGYTTPPGEYVRNYFLV